jgi:hypothetical protein
MGHLDVAGVMMRKEKSVALGLFAISVLYAAGCLKLKLGDFRQPGPGLFPSLIAAVLLLSAGVYLYRVFKNKGDDDEPGQSEGLSQKDLRTLGGLCVCIFAYPALLAGLDFIPATFCILFGMLLILKFRSWPVSLVVSLFTALLCFIVFAMLLGVALPSGAMEMFLYKLKG